MENKKNELVKTYGLAEYIIVKQMLYNNGIYDENLIERELKNRKSRKADREKVVEDDCSIIKCFHDRLAIIASRLVKKYNEEIIFKAIDSLLNENVDIKSINTQKIEQRIKELENTRITFDDFNFLITALEIKYGFIPVLIARNNLEYPNTIVEEKDIIELIRWVQVDGDLVDISCAILDKMIDEGIITVKLKEPQDLQEITNKPIFKKAISSTNYSSSSDNVLALYLTGYLLKSEVEMLINEEILILSDLEKERWQKLGFSFPKHLSFSINEEQ